MRPAALLDRRFERRQVPPDSREIYRRSRREDQARPAQGRHAGAGATASLRTRHDPYPFGLRSGAPAISGFARKRAGGALGLLSIVPIPRLFKLAAAELTAC